MRKIGEKKGQVWVETVIYTLIGLSIIGIVLAGALPKINAKKDEIKIDQSIEALGTIDNLIYEIQRAGVGNKRIIPLTIKSGNFIIDMASDTITWELDSSIPYSEVNVSTTIGKINVTPTGVGPWKIELTSKYNMDLRFEDKDSGKKQFNPAPTPYKIVIENTGKDPIKGTIINFNEA
jgi:type II secretory pathway pseudopilin PulG